MIAIIDNILVLYLINEEQAYSKFIKAHWRC